MGVEEHTLQGPRRMPMITDKKLRALEAIVIDPRTITKATLSKTKKEPKQKLEKCSHGYNRIGCKTCSPVICRFCDRIESANRIRVHIKSKHSQDVEPCACGYLYLCRSCHYDDPL